MSADILHRRRQELSLEDLEYNQNIFDEGLYEVNKEVESLSGKSIKDFGFTLPTNSFSYALNNLEDIREINYDHTKLLQTIQDVRRLNTEQKLVYDMILSSVNSNEGKLFFLDAPGGTGKTFLIKVLLAKVRFDRKIALAVASSGIAATLLEGGRTAHSTFKLPLNICSDDVSSVCNISKQSKTGKLMQDCYFIVWDEASMSHKASVEALDRTMRDLRDKNSPMGGCTVLFSGEFRQILPVIARGTRADEVNASLKRSYLWPHIIKCRLKTNMRISLSSEDNRQFSDNLFQIGNGVFQSGNVKINLYNICTLVSNVEELVEKVYPDIINITTKTLNWFKERAILAPTNEQVDKINDLILAKFEASSQIYYSVDTVIDMEEAVHYPTEFLNSLMLPGIPPHKLFLKVGSPIILLRNLNPPILCNGTRLKIVSLKNFLLECLILTGCGTGESVLIPRIPMIPSELPFQFKRIQFPIKLAFGITINKAQCQTLNVAGIDLTNQCFSHGQLYVALSRMTSKSNLFVYANNPTEVMNVVYKEIFL